MLLENCLSFIQDTIQIFSFPYLITDLYTWSAYGPKDTEAPIQSSTIWLKGIMEFIQVVQ